MRILVSPGPFKESLTADEAADAMVRGIQAVMPEALINRLPISDGGTGLTDRLVLATEGRIERVQVTGPRGAPVEAAIGLLGDGKTIVVESATAGGLALLDLSDRNPLLTSTVGVGELVKVALRFSPSKIIIGCGDSATNDGGLGAAQALGICFLRSDGSKIPYGSGGGSISEIVTIDDRHKVVTSGVNFDVACNLSSILCGPQGTSRIYGPQKGAKSADIPFLEGALDHWAWLLKPYSNLDLRHLLGAGGSGGLASAFVAFFNARLCFAFDIVSSYLRLDEHLKNSDLILTGEGTLDDRTAAGKLVCSLALRAKRYSKPVVVIAGEIADDAEDVFYNGVDAAFSLCMGPISRQQAMQQASKHLEFATEMLFRTLRCGSSLPLARMSSLL